MIQPATDLLTAFNRVLKKARLRRRTPKSVRNDSGRQVLVYFPEPVIAAVDLLVVSEDTDRSKWIRKAIREALNRRGVPA